MQLMTCENGSLYHPVDLGSGQNVCLHIDGNLFLAPVAGWSDRAFRTVCARRGAVFACTEMVSAEAIVRGNKNTIRLLARGKAEKALAVQLFGSKPDVMGKAAAMVAAMHITEGDDSAPLADCIDINCGCPVPKVVKTGSGSALMCDAARLGDAVRAIVEAVPSVPVTIKIRKGWSDESGDAMWQSVARAALDGGVAAITMHPRTRAQGYSGKADWRTLAALVSFVGGQVPIIGSGDLFTAQDARNMLLQTGVDAVIFARGAMGNPFIFDEAKSLLLDGAPVAVSAAERIASGMEELDLLIADAGEEAACKIMRKRFVAYTKGIAGTALLRSRMVQASCRADFAGILSTIA